MTTVNNINLVVNNSILFFKQQKRFARSCPPGPKKMAKNDDVYLTPGIPKILYNRNSGTNLNDIN